MPGQTKISISLSRVMDEDHNGGGGREEDLQYGGFGRSHSPNLLELVFMAKGPT